MTDEQVISRASEFIRLLAQLGSNGRTELLNGVKLSGSNPPSFVFQNHDDLGSREDLFFDEELSVQPPPTEHQ
jgi:hypothetical protein